MTEPRKTAADALRERLIAGAKRKLPPAEEIAQLEARLAELKGDQRKGAAAAWFDQAFRPDVVNQGDDE